MFTVNRNELINLIAEFVATVTNMKMYPQNHPHVNALFNRFYDSIVRFFTHTPELTIFLFDEDIIAYDKPLANPGLPGESFRKILYDKNIERITMLAGLPKLQLYQLISDLASAGKQNISATSHIKLGKMILDEYDEDNHVYADKTVDFYLFKHRAARELKDIYQSVKVNQLPDPGRVKQIASDFISIYNKSINPLRIIAQVKSDDDYTYVHITNVALLTICFADFLGFSGKYLEDIGIAALLHDVGKMFIPDEILNKQGILDQNERAVMESHTLKGAQFIGYQKDIPNLALLVALEHHIMYNGAGYPKIKPDWRPNITSQMISIIDTYDAMRSKRPYKNAAPVEVIEAALQEGRGTIYNPVLVDNFFHMLQN